MPPKKTNSGASKKVETKKKEKIIEDKTFGLKNKKGGKNQKYIAQVEKQVKSGGLHPLGAVNPKKDEKEKKLLEAKELAALFKPVQTQKVEKGTDPKTVLCAFFKAGQCGKGDRCKFSHDLNVERKVEKRSLYVDMRDDEGDTMDNWDEEKLQQVVNTKQGSDKRTNITEIICKFFLDAVEKSKYGWFWECPNGANCIYRHALPNGYVLKRDKKKMEAEKGPDISLVDLIEKERNSLGSATTKVTLESFLMWKKRKIAEKTALRIKEEEQKKKDYKSGKQFGISGKDMFSFNPDLADDGDMEDGDAVFEYARSDDDDDEAFEYKELDLEAMSLAAQEVDGSGTVAHADRLTASTAAADDDSGAATPTSSTASSGKSKTNGADATAINENLFLDEDLAGLDDELNDLDLDED